VRVPALERFADPDSGRIRRLETVRGKIMGDIVPTLAPFGTYAVKLAMLAPLVAGGGWAMAAIGVVAVAVTTFIQRRSSFDPKKESSSVFDANNWDERGNFMRQYGQNAENVLHDIDFVCHSLGKKNRPLVWIITDRKNERCYTAAAAACGKGGKESVVIIGQQSLETLTRKEMRAVITHEMAHIKLKHPNMRVDATGRKIASGIMSIAVVAAAVVGPLAFIPTLVTLAGLSLADRFFDTAQAKYHERVADYTTNMITGEGEKISSGIAKMRQMLKDNRHQIRDDYNNSLTGFYENMRDMAIQSISRKLWKKLYDTHPPDSERLAASQAFTARYESFCAQRRGICSGAFNMAARDNADRFSSNRPRNTLAPQSVSKHPVSPV
jgi:hypothetical protein